MTGGGVARRFALGLAILVLLGGCTEATTIELRNTGPGEARVRMIVLYRGEPGRYEETVSLEPGATDTVGVGDNKALSKLVVEVIWKDGTSRRESYLAESLPRKVVEGGRGRLAGLSLSPGGFRWGKPFPTWLDRVIFPLLMTGYGLVFGFAWWLYRRSSRRN